MINIDFSKLSNRNRMALAAGFVVFVLVVISVIGGKNNDVYTEEITARVQKRDFRVRIVENGVLEALNSITLASKISGNEAKIVSMVPEGIQVATGDEIMRFDPTPFEEKIREYKAALAVAQARWGEARDNLKMEETKYNQQLKTSESELELARFARRNVIDGEGKLELIEKREEAAKLKAKLDAIQSFIDESKKELEKEEKPHLIKNLQSQIRKKNIELEEAKGEHEIARQRHEIYRDFIYPEKKARAEAEEAAADLALKQIEGSYDTLFATWTSRVSSAKAVLEKARSNLALAEKQLDRTIINAPADGFVVYNEIYVSGEKRKVRIGDAVWVNLPIITLPDISRMRVHTRIREIDIHLVEKDQRVKAFCNAFPDLKLKGIVEQIGALAEKVEERRSYEKYFDLKVLLEEAGENLRPGMTARVEIEVADVPNALLIPSGAVFVEEGKPYAYLANGKRRELKIGPGNGNFTVVKKGLKEGQEVLLVKPEEK
jgi:HlyD family secretion protein